MKRALAVHAGGRTLWNYLAKREIIDFLMREASCFEATFHIKFVVERLMVQCGTLALRTGLHLLFVSSEMTENERN